MVGEGRGVEREGERSKERGGGSSCLLACWWRVFRYRLCVRMCRGGREGGEAEGKGFWMGRKGF